MDAQFPLKHMDTQSLRLLVASLTMLMQDADREKERSDQKCQYCLAARDHYDWELLRSYAMQILEDRHEV